MNDQMHFCGKYSNVDPTADWICQEIDTDKRDKEDPQDSSLLRLSAHDEYSIWVKHCPFCGYTKEKNG